MCCRNLDFKRVYTVRIGAFISIVLVMHVLVSANGNRRIIKSIFSLPDVSDSNI